MSKTTKKFYVVWKGQKPGIYENWEDCKKQVHGFEGAYYMSFLNLAQAELAFGDNMWKYLKPKTSKIKHDTHSSGSSTPLWESISVDAACSGNPGVMEYQGVNTRSGERIFHRGPFQDATNNTGEFLAIVHALALLKQQGKTMPIYSDSKTAITWVKNKHAKTKLEPTENNRELFDTIRRAEAWLKNNTWTTAILKWDTELWGEIPADFGRKK